MILDPGVLALITGSAVSFFLVAAGCVTALGILRRWAPGSGSEAQIALERRTHLASAAVVLALGFESASLFLFLFIADDLHRVIVGAMCATGSLNANPVGWYALAVKAALLFAAALWVMLNGVDLLSERLPLVRLKFGLLLGLAPLVAADCLLQAAYFAGIRPDVITSCCGSLFTSGGDDLASTLSSFPPRPTLLAFCGGCLLFAVLWAWRRLRPSPLSTYAFAAAAAAMLPLGLTAVVSVFSLYIYESPVHHCPFDLFQAGYGYLGYPLFGSLALGTLFGTAVGLFQPLRRSPLLGERLGLLQDRWATASLLFMALFAALAAWKALFGSFRLLPYG